jgi:formamidopyrimidine-DNA glycosylase
VPELPEVEVVRRELARLRGGTIVGLASDDDRVFASRHDVVGRSIRELGRRGKWLRFELDEGFVFSHLGMTGDWTLRRAEDAPLQFERVRMEVEHAGEVTSARYTDPRRFGRFVTAPEDIEAWRALGPDPLLDGIDEARVLGVLKKRKRAVKEVLLDQSLLAGVGNILAIEALWNAQIDPRTRANLMTASDVRAIARGLRAIIRRTIAHDERMARSGPRASLHLEAPFRVYGHAKEPCPRCGTTLRAIVLGGRGTTFCPGCQKAHAPLTASRGKRPASSDRAPRRAARR